MKKIILLTAAVVFGMSMFSFTAFAEEGFDFDGAVKAIPDAFTITDEIFPAEESVIGTVISEDSAAVPDESAESGNDDETDSGIVLPGSLLAADENKNENQTEGESRDIGEIIDESVDKNTGEENEGSLPSYGEGAQPEGENETEIISPDTEPSDGEKPWLFLSGKNIPVINGTYDYELSLKPHGKLTFDNFLINTYQGVDGRYKLHYEIAELNNHIMVATGTFKNILNESPLIKIGRDIITNDSYSYQLDLRTNEGFSFKNNLRYLFNGELRGYSLNYNYDLLKNEQTLETGDPLSEEEEESVFWQMNKQLRKSRSIFADYISSLLAS